MAIVLWIGMMIVAQAFDTIPRAHTPAVVVGLLPGIGAWGAMLAKNGLRAAGLGGPAGPFTERLVAEFQKNDLWITGAFAIEQGVTVIGTINLASTVPYHASQIYARNITAFLLHLFRDGKFHPDPDDEIFRETLVTQDGEVVNARVREFFALPALTMQSKT